MPGSQVSVCCCCENSLWITLVKKKKEKNKGGKNQPVPWSYTDLKLMYQKSWSPFAWLVNVLVPNSICTNWQKLQHRTSHSCTRKTDHPLVDWSTCPYQTLYAPATGCGKQALVVPHSVCNSQLLLWFTLVSCCHWLPCKATCDCNLRLALVIWLSWMPWGQAGWGLWLTPGSPHAEWCWWWGNEQAVYGPVLDPGWSTWKGKYMNYLQVQGPIHTSSDIKSTCW